jgi:aspartyl protease family protein
MRHVLLIAALLLIVIGMAVTRLSQGLLHPEAAVARAATTAGPAVRGELTLPRAGDGHFHAEARVDGRSGIGFIVDTGASTIALRASDAARIGHRPFKGDYSLTISTANGTVKAARVQLQTVEIGDVTVRDVAAVVLPDEALPVNLLGMTYLSRLRKFEVAGGKLMLVQ